MTFFAFLITWTNAFCASFISTYEKGCQAYVQQNFTQAETIFENLIKIKPEPAFLFNAGLSAYKNKKIGKTIGYWKKALYQDPSFNAARKGLAWLYTQKTNLPLSMGWKENIYFFVFRWIPKNIFFFIHWTLFIGLGFLLLVKKGALFQKTFSTLLFLILSFPIVLELQNKFSPQGTILKKQEVRSGPKTYYSSLFTVSLGESTTLLRMQEGWVQVKHKNKGTGWVPQNTLFQHTGRSLW